MGEEGVVCWERDFNYQDRLTVHLKDADVSLHPID